MNVIHTNIYAANADRQFKINKKKNDKTAEKLASGYQINRAADDTAGLSISEKLRWQIRGLKKASRNAQEGISLIQSADGTLSEIHDMLQRANELAVQAANGTMTEADRAASDSEIQQLKKEIDTAAKQAVFNGIRLFPDDGYPVGMASVMESYQYQLSLNPAAGIVTVQNAGTSRAAHPALNAVSDGHSISDIVVNEMLPKAVNQIFSAFPSLKNDVGNQTIQLSVNVKYIDGANKTLAQAGYSYGKTGRPVTMELRIDSSDFTLADAQGTGTRAEVLQSTIAHEFMHTIMQYTLTDGMSGRNGNSKYPSWFTEGTAQLAGGGFPTQWNNQLLAYAAQLAGENDASQDANIKKYLQSYTPAGRPYGHGYLATAYIGYLANGGGSVTGANIAAGMDRIFADLLQGKKLDDVLLAHTGMRWQQINKLFSNGDPALTEFVRKLSYASRGGAGSVITPALNVGGTGILGTGSSNPNPNPNPNPNLPPVGGNGNELMLQIGATEGITAAVRLYEVSTTSLGLQDTNVMTQEACGWAMDEVLQAIDYISTVRSHYGAIQNRLEFTILNLDNTTENTTAAESALRDTDMAQEMVQYSIQQILMQAGLSMMAQANHQPEMLLALLR